MYFSLVWFQSLYPKPSVLVQRCRGNSTRATIPVPKKQPLCIEVNLTVAYIQGYCDIKSKIEVHIFPNILNTLRPRQNGRHSADDVLKCILFNENVWILLKNSLMFVPNGQINNIPSLVQIMAWRRPGDKPLSEPIIVSLLTHICVIRPQWVYTYCNAQSMEKHRLAVNTFIPTHNSVQKTNNRSCWCGGARKKRKLQACNHLLCVGINVLTTNLCFSIDWALQWRRMCSDPDFPTGIKPMSSRHEWRVNSRDVTWRSRTNQLGISSFLHHGCRLQNQTRITRQPTQCLRQQEWYGRKRKSIGFQQVTSNPAHQNTQRHHNSSNCRNSKLKFTAINYGGNTYPGGQSERDNRESNFCNWCHYRSQYPAFIYICT